MTPNDLLVQRDGRVWYRPVVGGEVTRLGTVNHRGSVWEAVCTGCPTESGLNILGVERTRQNALWAITEHWNDALEEPTRQSTGTDDARSSD